MKRTNPNPARKSAVPGGHGLFMYKGMYQTSQSTEFERVLKPFFEEQQFTDIVEIGTFKGGFTLFMRDTLPHASVTTYDIVNHGVNFLADNNVSFIETNVFDYSTQTVVDETFKARIENSEKLLLAIDGFDKPSEFAAVAKLMRPGDTIMVHDFVQDDATADEFHEQGKWHWFETFGKDIDPICEEHNLNPIYPESLEVVWAIRRKS
jgi:predicted O-methyltransferase YrrM